MSSDGCVTAWIEQLKTGDSQAAQELWNHYFGRLVQLARNKLGDHPRRAADEEDVALSAFNSFWRGVEEKRFPQLADRQDLWKLLVTITSRKAYAQLEHERRQKRGQGQVRGDSVLFGNAGSSSPEGFDRLIGSEPTPEFAVCVAEECGRLLELLDDATLRTVALKKMEGYTNNEIADALSCKPRTVERKLQLIRKLWSQEV